MRDGFQTARSWAKRPVISWVAASSGNQNMRELPDTNATKMQECVVICTVGRQEWHGMAVNLVKIFCKRLSFMCPNSSKFIQHRLRLIIQLIRHCWGLGPIYTHNIHIYSIHQLNLVQPYSICLLIIKLHSLLVCLSSYVLTVHHSVTSWVPHSNGTGPLCKLLLYSEHQRNTHTVYTNWRSNIFKLH